MKREDLKVGDIIIDRNDDKVEITAIGEQRFLFKTIDGNGYERVDGFGCLKDYKTLPKPPKKLFAFEKGKDIIFKNTEFYEFHIEEGGSWFKRKPEYDIVYPGGEDE